MKKFTNLVYEISGGNRPRMAQKEKMFLIAAAVFFITALVLASHADWQSFLELHKNI